MRDIIKNKQMSVESGPNIRAAKRDKPHLLSPTGLRIERNGIDREATPTKRLGSIYEDYVFDLLLEQFPQDFIVGPRLLDFMGDTCHSSLFNSQGRTRPDFLILSNYVSRTFLTGIAEAKSGKKPNVQEKANGFGDLIDAIEAAPTAIYQGLKLAVGNVVDKLPIYPDVIVPLEDSLGVIFIAHYNWTTEVRGQYSNLHFSYQAMPLPPERFPS